MLNERHPMIEFIKELQIIEDTCYRWLHQPISKNAETNKCTKELEKQNARLKTLLANQFLPNEILAEGTGKNSKPEPRSRAVRIAMDKFADIRTRRLPSPEPEPVRTAQDEIIDEL